MNGNQNHIVIPNNSSDDKTLAYTCKGCEFEADNLHDVAQHVVENQFVVSNTK